MRSDDFSSEQETKLARDFWISVAKGFEFTIAQRTDFTVLQGRDGANMVSGRDCLRAEHFSGHVEIGYLFAAVFVKDGAFKRAEPGDEKRIKGVAGSEQYFAFRNSSLGDDMRGKNFCFCVIQIGRQAEVPEITAGTAGAICR